MLNSDPFAWAPQDEETQEARQGQFVDLLSRGMSAAPLDWLFEELLSRDP